MYINGALWRARLYSSKGRIGPEAFVKGLTLIVLLHALIVMLGAYNFHASAILGLLSLSLLYPLFCLLIKRSHDGGKSGWYSCLWFFILLMVWFIMSAIAQNLTGGDLLLEMNNATLAALEANDFEALLKVSENYAQPIAQKTNVAVGLARLTGLVGAGALLNMMIGADLHDNQYGPAGNDV